MERDCFVLEERYSDCQRWERTEGLPLHRLGQDRTGSCPRNINRAGHLVAAAGVAASPAEADSGVATEPPTYVAGFSALGILSLLIIAAAAIWKIWPSKTITYHPVPLTSDHGWETQPSFSPDARQIAYVWNPPGGKPSIYIKSIGADSTARLTSGTQPEFSPAWSPDGRSRPSCSTAEGNGLL